MIRPTGAIGLEQTFFFPLLKEIRWRPPPEICLRIFLFRAQAVQDVLALKPVSFVYKGDPGKHRRVGLVLEDSPESVRSKAGAVVFDERLMNLELALQAARTRSDALKGEISRLEGGRR